jgi:hypothetical protein
LFGAEKFSRFEQAILHLHAAYNLVRWLIRNEDDAANAIHDARLVSSAAFAVATAVARNRRGE